MAHQINNIYTFDDQYETLLDWSAHNDLNPNPNPAIPLNSNNSEQNPNRDNQNPSQSSHWRPFPRFQNLYNKFQNNILAQ